MNSADYESVLRSHQIIADLQALHRNKKREEEYALCTGKPPLRTKLSMNLEWTARLHGASGEAIRHAEVTKDMTHRISAISGFLADLNASRPTAQRTLSLQ